MFSRATAGATPAELVGKLVVVSVLNNAPDISRREIRNPIMYVRPFTIYELYGFLI